MAQTTNGRPTWMIVVALLILLPLLVWVLAITVNILAALSIGGLLLAAAIIGLFMWTRQRVEQR